MRWLTFSILAGLCLVLQTSLVPKLAIWGVRPDWMFVLAVFYALLGGFPDACIAAWILGLLTDLASANDHVGLYAFCYGGTAWLIYHVRELVFREHWLAHAATTLLAGLLMQFVVAVYRAFRAPVGAGAEHGVWTFALLTCVYTAFWAPYFHWGLTRLRRATGFRSVMLPSRGKH
jgi:rod shape-determining protein MreD